MTIVFFFQMTAGNFYTIAERVPDFAAAMEASAAYHTIEDPDYVGAALVPDENLATFNPIHTIEILQEANGATA